YQADALAHYYRIVARDGFLLAWIAQRNPSSFGYLMLWHGPGNPKWMRAPFVFLDPIVVEGDRLIVLDRGGGDAALRVYSLTEAESESSPRSTEEQLAALLRLGGVEAEPGESDDLDEFKKIPGAFEGLLAIAANAGASERMRAIQVLGEWKDARAVP